MVIAKLAINVGRGLLLKAATGAVEKAYEKIMLDRINSSSRIDEYRVPDNNYFSGGSLKEVAQRYGLDGVLNDYKHSIFERIGSYLSELKSLTSYLHDAHQSNKTPSAYELNVYAAVQMAHDLMLGLLGYKPSSAAPKNYAYLSDVVNDYLDKIGEMNKKLDRFLAAASGLNTDGSGIVEMASKRAAKFVAYQVLEKRGIPVDSLERILSSATKPFAELRKKAKPLFAEYQDIAGKWKAYAADVSGNYAYGVAA